MVANNAVSRFWRSLNVRLLLVVIAALAIAILVTLWTARLDRVSRLDRSVARLTTRVSGEEMFGGRYLLQAEKAAVIGGRPEAADGFAGGAVRCDTAIRFKAKLQALKCVQAA